MSSTYPSFFNGELPNIFNPSDFYTTQYIPNLQTDSAIVTTNLLASNNNVIQVSNDDGTTSTGATQSYVDNAINNLSNTLLGTNIPNQLNQNLDTILEIDNFITDLKTNTDTNTSNIYNLQNDVINHTSSIQTIQTNQLNDHNNITALQTRITTDESYILANSNNIITNTNDIASLQSRLTINEANISSNSDNIIVNTNNITLLQTRLTNNESIITTNTNDIASLQSRLLNDEADILLNKNNINSLQSSKQNLLIFDSTLIENSNNVVSSGNIKTYVDTGLELKLSSTNPTFSGVLTGNSIIDNGSFTASRNVTLGTNTNNNLIVNSNAVFNGTLTLNNQDVNNRISNLESGKQNLLIYDLTPITNSNNVISSGNIKTYVDSSISNLVSSAPSTLDTLNELATALGNDPNFSTTITNLIGTKASTNNPIFTGILSAQSISDNGSFTAAGDVNLGTSTSNTLTVNSNSIFNGTLKLNNQDLNIRLNSDETNISNLQSSKQNLLIFDSSPILNSNNVLTSGNIYNALLNYVTSTFFTNTISNYLTNSSASAIFQTKLIYDSVPTLSSNNSLTSGNIYTALQNYLTSSSASATYQTISNMSNYLTSSTASTTYQTIANMSNYLTSSSASTTYQTIANMSNYLTSSNASSTYQTIANMSNYLTTTNASSTYQTIANMSNYLTSSLNLVSENIYNSGSGTNLSLNYTSIKGIVKYSPSSNFTLTITNVPTSNINSTYTITFIYNTLFYCNAISVNGISYTMRAAGGLSNISISGSSNFVMQTITIAFLNSSTPIVLTNVSSLY